MADRRLCFPDQITVCGGGNAAHALVGISLLQKTTRQVRVYLPLASELNQFLDALSSGFAFEVRIGSTVHHVPTDRIHATGDPVESARSALIVMVVPAFAHYAVLSKLSPYLTEEHVVAAIPARSGFEYQACEILGNGDRVGCCIVGFQTLPWACRVNEFGHSVTIYGTKRHVGAACLPTERAAEMARTFSNLLNVTVIPYQSMLELSLANTGQLIHPGIMYACFADRREEVFPSEAEIPPFYASVDEESAAVLSRMSDEVLAIREAIEANRPGFTMPKVVHLSQWLREAYGNDIKDTSTLARMFQTNRGYQGLTVPVRRINRRYRVDVHARYLTEDLPFGLVVTKGIASVLGVATPTIDEVITRTSRWVGKEYLINGQLAGRDIVGTRAPQRYNIHVLEGLILQ